jgi:hypothetical protein
MNRSVQPFDREPIERGYRMMALAAAIHKITDGGNFEHAEMDIRHLAAAIEDEAHALVDELEKAEQAARNTAAA